MSLTTGTLTDFGAGLRQGLGHLEEPPRDHEAERRVRRFGTDREGFYNYYLAHWFTVASAECHREFDEALERPEPTVRGAPRDHAKSTRLVAADVLYCLAYKLAFFLVIVRAIQDEAEEVVEAIRLELETNERLRRDFGDLYDPRRWSIKGFVTRWAQMVIAKSRGGKIRGIKFRQRRPDRVYLDDIDDDESVNTVEQREKTWKWGTKAVVPSIAPGGKLIIPGTILHEDGFLARALKNPLWDGKVYRAVLSWPKRMDLWEHFTSIIREVRGREGKRLALAFYEEHKAQMDEGAKVLWAERYSLLDLMLKRIEIGTSAFEQEYQNEPRDEATAIVRAEWIIDYAWADVWGKLPLSIYTICDPATGKSSQGCDTALVTIGACCPRIYVLEALAGNWTPLETVERMYAAWQRWKPLGVVIETVTFQVIFAQLLEQVATARGKVLPIRTIDYQTADKVARIQSLATFIENGVIRFLPEQTELKHQLLFYRGRKGDRIDLADALEMGIRQVNLGGGPIEYAGSGVPNTMAASEF